MLDVVFLSAIASSNTVLAIAAFVVLLQLSSNFAQGPFQGYVPGPRARAPRWGWHPPSMGLFSVLGNVTGFARRRGRASAANQFFVATMALGVIEVATMISVVCG